MKIDIRTGRRTVVVGTFPRSGSTRAEGQTTVDTGGPSWEHENLEVPVEIHESSNNALHSHQEEDLDRHGEGVFVEWVLPEIELHGLGEKS